MKKIFIICCILGLLCGKANAITNEELTDISRMVFNECKTELDNTQNCFSIARATEVVEMFKLDNAQKKEVWKDIPVCIVSYPDLTVEFELCVYKVVRLVVLGSK